MARFDEQQGLCQYGIVPRKELVGESYYEDPRDVENELVYDGSEDGGYDKQLGRLFFEESESSARVSSERRGWRGSGEKRRRVLQIPAP
ncbi:hypothetical protein FRC09_003386 [Ceratobasidium sp. 395]|nr:hypothetical protein FRC09_003386 [Ceratobasidium sp. 395]